MLRVRGEGRALVHGGAEGRRASEATDTRRSPVGVILYVDWLSGSHFTLSLYTVDAILYTYMDSCAITQ